MLVVGGTLAAQAARAQTSTVPIVFTLAGDPVGTGLVASLARPGGNVTGLSLFHPEMSAKDLEVLKSAVPGASRIAVIYNPLNPVTRASLEQTREAARAMAVELQPVEVRGPENLPKAFATIMAGKPNALLGTQEIDTHCAVETEAEALARQAIARLALSARAYHRVLRVARTIADLAGRPAITTAHLAETLQYRVLDQPTT